MMWPSVAAIKRSLARVRLRSSGWRKQAREDVIGRALRLYNLEGARVERLHQDSDRIIRVRTAADDYLLRLYFPPDRRQGHGSDHQGHDDFDPTGSDFRSAKVLRAQLDWLSFMRGQSLLLLPESIATRDGSPVAEIGPVAPGFICNAVLMRWLPGVQRHPAAWLPEHAHFAARGLASLHERSENYHASKDSALPSWDWQWAFGPTAYVWSLGRKYFSREEIGTFESAARHTHDALQELGDHPRVFGVIHRDFTSDNLIIDGDRMGLIDFDMCGRGHHVFDLSVFRMSMQRLPVDRRKDIWSHFLTGYRSIRPLPCPSGGAIERYVGTYDVLQRASTLNARLQRLNTDALTPVMRARLSGFVRASSGWVRNRMRQVGAGALSLEPGIWTSVIVTL